MLTHQLTHTVWLLLLLHVCGNAWKFNLFNGDLQPKEGDVRLFGSKDASEGRVEVYHSGKWGTVCDDGWDMAEAQVVCRQLHFPGAKSIVTGNSYGQATGPIWLDDFNCNGTENHLLTCRFKSWGITDCTHKEDVGVICESNNVTSSDATLSLDHSFSLSDDLRNIFESGHSCDFLILVKSSTGNRQENGTMEIIETTVCAHKFILSQFPLFNASAGISNITVHVSQSCLPHFTSFISYIYTRKIDVTFSSVQCLHWMASTFGVKKLMEDAGTLFSKFLPEDTSFYYQMSLYKYAEETGDLVLQENCIQYLAWNYQNLTRSPTWTHLPVELFGTLLARSDLVVPDEYFLLQSTESWLTEKGYSISTEMQVQLLSRIRFPMIPAEKLFELESSSLYSTHKNMYQKNIMKALQFNVLLFTNLSSNPKFHNDDDDFQPRIYTAEPWSIAFSPMSTSSESISSRYRNVYSGGRYTSNRGNPYSQDSHKYFRTPVHNSLIFKDYTIQWEARVFRNQYDCSNQGMRCESLPMARLTPRNQLSQEKNVHFHNRLLLMCQGNYISQVQDFKANLAYIAVNGTDYIAYPCPDNLYTYHFVVRPVYF